VTGRSPATDAALPASSCRIGVVGATGLVGRWLLRRLAASGRPVLACSRTGVGSEAVDWCRPGGPLPAGAPPPREWIAACPLWATADLAGWLAAEAGGRLVALSSTSLMAKRHSRDAGERRVADRLARAEERLADWAATRGVTLSILRPTMIYDGTHDGNVAAIAACARRCGVVPLCGPARGLRQPVHADDVAAACLAALAHPRPAATYTLSGGEALPFRALVERTCRARGLGPWIVHLPRPLWRGLATLARGVGLAGDLSPAAGDRMNEDLVYDHAAARDELGFRPRPFEPAEGRIVGSAASATAAGHGPPDGLSR